MRTFVSAVVSASLLVASLAVAAELQVPLDHAGRVQRIDAGLARRIKMFTDRPDFQEARLFLMTDSSFVLEISSLRGAGLTRERIPLTPAGADSIRGLVTTGLAEHKTTPTLDSSGRPLFVASTTAMCFGFYGWAIPYLFFDENASSETVTGTYLVTASAGTFLPLWYTRQRSVTVGAALLSWYGMSRGTLHGALLPFALTEDPAEKSPVGTAFVMSIAEGIAGFEWASRTNMTEGSALAISNGSDFGVLYGLGFSHLFDATGSAAAAGTLIGSGVGLTAGALYAPHRDHTYGDASVMRTAGWLGGYAGLALVQALSQADDYEKSSTIGAMTGATAGLFLGDGLVRKTDFTFGQGVVVDLCTIGGGLLGLGLAAFYTDDSEVQRRLYWTASAAGSVSGYFIGYTLGASSARRAATDRSAWRLDIVPMPPATRGGMPGATIMLTTVMR